MLKLNNLTRTKISTKNLSRVRLLQTLKRQQNKSFSFSQLCQEKYQLRESYLHHLHQSHPQTNRNLTLISCYAFAKYSDTNNDSNNQSFKPSKYFENLYKTQKYYEILNFPTQYSNFNKSTLTDDDIKRQYYQMIKKYHSDFVHDSVVQQQNEQITKYIILAYDNIIAQRIKQKINQGTYKDEYKLQDQVSMKLYKKTFNQIKYELFKEGNEQKKMKFMQELRKLQQTQKGHRTYSSGSGYSNNTYKNHYNNHDTYNTNNSQNNKIWKQTIAFGLIVTGIYGLIDSYSHNSKSNKILHETKSYGLKHGYSMTDQEAKNIQEKTRNNLEKRLNDFIDLYTCQMPPSLTYPTKQDPPQIEQLIEYTIASDIHLYETSSEFFEKKQEGGKGKKKVSSSGGGNSGKNKTTNNNNNNNNLNFSPQEILAKSHPITKAKTNTMITLSLEAERCLQNIYIKVSDILKQIQTTGTYTPPLIIFRYYGYIMFQIRPKPLSLSNYRQTQYISLFDLFFDYYSPIPIKRHQYNEYVVGLNEQKMIHFGQVHLNVRKINEQYISKNEKVVIIDGENSYYNKELYENTWKDFYKKNQNVWREKAMSYEEELKRGYRSRYET